MTLRAYRQGDVVVREEVSLSWVLEHAIKSADFRRGLETEKWAPRIVADPKITGRNGHDHRLIPTSSLTIIIWTSRDTFDVYGSFKLVHPEHGTMEIPHGIWSVYRTREWPMEEPRGD